MLHFYNYTSNYFREHIFVSKVKSTLTILETVLWARCNTKIHEHSRRK